MKEYNDIDLYDTLRELGLKYRDKSKEVLLDNCPFCEKDRNKKSDHFYFSKETGQFRCVKCNEAGNVVTFRRFMGIEPFSVQKVYKKISVDVVASYTKQPDCYFQAYESARGIPVEILKSYAIGKAKHGEIGVCRTYPYIDVNGDVVNIKYVNQKKEMRQEKDTRKIYFGLQFVDFQKDDLNVTEGEDDTLALKAMGFDNVVSVPNGAGFYNEEMGNVNRKFKKIYLFFDADKAGEEGAERFARKAGVWKCYRIDLPFKDARECLQNGLDIFDIEKYKSHARKYDYKPEDHCRPALSVDERIDRYEVECAENMGGVRFGIPIFDQITGGLRSDVVGIIANPGCFKTTTLMNLLSMAGVGDGISLFFSFEMGVEQMFERECQIVTRVEPAELRTMGRFKTEEWSGIKKMMVALSSKLYVSEESHSDVEQMIKIIEHTEEMNGKKVKIVGVDYLDFVKSKNFHEYDSVREVMNDFKSKIARGKKIPVIVLAQTNRGIKDNDTEVKMRSGKGGTGIESSCDFLIGLWEKNDDVIGRFLKHRRIDSYKGYVMPYFRLDIDRKSYKVSGFVPIDKPVGETEEF